MRWGRAGEAALGEAQPPAPLFWGCHIYPPLPQAGGQDESLGRGAVGGEKDVSNNRSHRDFP